VNAINRLFYISVHRAKWPYLLMIQADNSFIQLARVAKLQLLNI